MKKHIIRLNEGDLRSIIRESVYHLLNEIHDREMNTEGDLIFYIPKTHVEGISHFLQKIGSVSNMAKKSNCGSIKVDTETVTKQMSDVNEKGEKVITDVEYLKITVTPTVPHIQVPGYKYIGTITPMVLNINGERKEHMMIALSEEFTGNDYYEKVLKQSSQVMKCDGCNRERARGIYFCFLEEKTGNVMKLGGSCAARFFGVDVATKVKNLFEALSQLGTNSPYAIYDPDGDLVDYYTDPVMAELNRVLDSWEKEKLEDAIMKGCWAIAEHGVNCYMKTSMGGAEIYKSIILACARKADRSGKTDVRLYKLYMEEEKKKNPKIFEMKDKASDLMYEFLKDGIQFFYEMQPKSDFEKKLQDIGLLITGGMIQKKRLNFEKYINFIPYCVQTYFKSKAASAPTNTDSPQPMQPFDGYKKMNVTINVVEKKQTKTMKNYYAVLATTDDNEIAKWHIWDSEPDFKMGDKITIVATYNPKYKTLENVKTDREENGSQSNDMEVITYPESGFKYMNKSFTIVRLTPKFLIVKNNQDNCEYFISNFKPAYSYYDISSFKFDLDELSENSEITLTGTVKAYEKSDGTTGYSLIRVKGLPPYRGGGYDDEE